MTALAPVSFLVPAYNASDTLHEAVTSILDGNLLEGDEVIIVDDGSTDDTLRIAHELERSSSAVRVTRHLRNKGSANAGRNTAADCAMHDLFLNLDADNRLLPGSVLALREHLAAEQCDVVGFGSIDYFDHATGAITQRWPMRPVITFLGNLNAPAETPGSSGNYLYTRDAWARAGRCPESVGAAWDSMAFTIDLLGTGSTFHTVPGTSYLHRVGTDSAFIRDARRHNQSLLFLEMILPYLDQLHPDDVDHIMSPDARTSWAELLDVRPLRAPDGATERGRTNIAHRELPAGEILGMLWAKVRRRVPLLRR